MLKLTTLFDIVNVQNWPAASASRGAEVPVARSRPLLSMIYFDHACESGAAGPLSIFLLFAGLAQREERRPRNAEAACSSHAAGTILLAFVAQLEEQLPGTQQAACSIHAEGTSFAPVAQPAGGGSLRKSTVQVRILPGAPSCFARTRFAGLSALQTRSRMPSEALAKEGSIDQPLAREPLLNERGDLVAVAVHHDHVAVAADAGVRQIDDVDAAAGGLEHARHSRRRPGGSSTSADGPWRSRHRSW